MQSVSSRIWTGVAMSISYDDNHYTTGTSIKKKEKERYTSSSKYCVLHRYREISTKMYVYNIVSPNVSLFLLQACCIFVWTCLYVCYKYFINFVF